MRNFAIIIFLSVAFLVANCSSAPPLSVSNRPVAINNGRATGGMPPTKNLEDMKWAKGDGETESLKDLAGHVVILDFWATYCGPCVEAIPHFVELQKKNPELRIVGLNVGGEDHAPEVPKFAAKLKINYTLGVPEDALVNLIFGNEDSIPQTVIFDKSGRMVKKFVGYSSGVKLEIEQIVKEELAK